MDPFGSELNELLVKTFRAISAIEEAMLKDMSAGQLTISEMHMIECVGRQSDTGASITDIAQEMGITLPSVTMAVQKLQKKGYVTKAKSAEDGRRVEITLTDAGRRADIAHRYFHRQMVKAVGRGIPEGEKDVLIHCLKNLNAFFQNRADELSPKEKRGKYDE
jgi:DNA-binding MarR family transcriptional regulator